MCSRWHCCHLLFPLPHARRHTRKKKQIGKQRCPGLERWRDAFFLSLLLPSLLFLWHMLSSSHRFSSLTLDLPLVSLLLNRPRKTHRVRKAHNVHVYCMWLDIRASVWTFVVPVVHEYMSCRDHSLHFHFHFHMHASAHSSKPQRSCSLPRSASVEFFLLACFTEELWRRGDYLSLTAAAVYYACRDLIWHLPGHQISSFEGRGCLGEAQ